MSKKSNYRNGIGKLKLTEAEQEQAAGGSDRLFKVSSGNPEIVPLEHKHLATFEQIAAYKKTLTSEYEGLQDSVAVGAAVSMGLGNTITQSIGDIKDYLHLADFLIGLYEGTNAMILRKATDPDIYVNASIGVALLMSDIIRQNRLPGDPDDGSFMIEPYKAVCRQVGEELNDLGGMPAMVAVAEIIHPGHRRLLEACWDGIGDWQF